MLAQLRPARLHSDQKVSRLQCPCIVSVHMSRSSLSWRCEVFAERREEPHSQSTLLSAILWVPREEVAEVVTLATPARPCSVAIEARQTWLSFHLQHVSCDLPLSEGGHSLHLLHRLFAEIIKFVFWCCHYFIVYYLYFILSFIS